jgi:hypothetical protein
VAVAGLVDALVFLPQVIGPVFVEVAAGVQGAELEDGLGAVQPRSGACYAHSVFDEPSAGSFDYAGGDGPAAGQGVGVVQVGCLDVEVAGAFVGGLGDDRVDLPPVPVDQGYPGPLAVRVAARGLVEPGGDDDGDVMSNRGGQPLCVTWGLRRRGCSPLPGGRMMSPGTRGTGIAS